MEQLKETRIKQFEGNKDKTIEEDTPKTFDESRPKENEEDQVESDIEDTQSERSDFKETYSSASEDEKEKLKIVESTLKRKLCRQGRYYF